MDKLEEIIKNSGRLKVFENTNCVICGKQAKSHTEEYTSNFSDYGDGRWTAVILDKSQDWYYLKTKNSLEVISEPVSNIETTELENLVSKIKSEVSSEDYRKIVMAEEKKKFDEKYREIKRYLCNAAEKTYIIDSVCAEELLKKAEEANVTKQIIENGKKDKMLKSEIKVSAGLFSEVFKNIVPYSISSKKAIALELCHFSCWY